MASHQSVESTLVCLKTMRILYDFVIVGINLTKIDDITLFIAGGAGRAV